MIIKNSSMILNTTISIVLENRNFPDLLEEIVTTPGKLYSPLDISVSFSFSLTHGLIPGNGAP